MMSLFKKSRHLLTPEEEIIRNRYINSISVGVIVSIFDFNPTICAMFACYLTLNFALHYLYRHNMWQEQKRWFASLLIDVAMGTGVMMYSPSHMAAIWPIMLWVILGNGFRFGVRFLYVASAVFTIAFGAVVFSTDYWAQNLPLGVALTAALLVIPAYCAKLIRGLSKAKEEAEAASRAKSYFLASVSHELRTPLNAIIGYGSHLQQLDMPANQREMVGASVLAGQHLLTLIEQLIQVAKSGASSATIDNAHFRGTDILAEIRDIMSLRAKDKGLALKVQAEPLSDTLVDGPRDTARNILLNLTGNAIKFTDSGIVAVCSGIEKAGDGWNLWFTVSDTGIGVAEDAIERIFQPFQQADDTVMNRFGGTGLGLSICKQMVEQAGGEISVSSDLGQGSCFRFTLPVAPVEEPVSAHDESAAIAPTRILSLGRFPETLLIQAQSAGNFALRQINCATADDVRDVIGKVDISPYSVVMITQRLAAEIGSEDEIWDTLSRCGIASVLVAEEQAPDLDDVMLRAAFASVIPPSTDFDKLRSALRIGASFASPAAADEPEPQQEIVELKPRKILVADDNRTNRNVLAAILKAKGHEVHMATDGDEALDMLEQDRFDAWLLDVNMPRLNGIDACRMWRLVEGGRAHMPVIGVTADATSETERRCLDAGMDLRVTKPVMADELLRTIERLCNAQDSGDAAELPSIEADPLRVVVSLSSTSGGAHTAIDPAQIEYLKSIGNDAFLQSMIDGFFEDVEESLEPVRRAVAQGNVQDFRFCAHAFKSSANNMGARALSALCGKLEKITEGEFEQQGRDHLASIEKEVARACDELKSPQVFVRDNKAANA